MTTSSALLALLALATGASAVEYLSPVNDINLPGTDANTNPLTWLGANGPWAAGPNVYNIDPEVPQGCVVDQVASISRHGSRYPDTGAYGEWTEMYSRFSAGNYTATGPLSFLPTWSPVLTNPTLQIAQLNPTGAKELHDLGYALRTRYPTLYTEGDDFYVWANNYTRVLQTAKAFVQGYLGPFAGTSGKIVSVTSKGFASSIGNSLAPGDSCPNFSDSNGNDQQAIWKSTWIPRTRTRLNALLTGLQLTESDVNLIPYLCGFESHITGRLSPFCGVFTDEELMDYEYTNDLRYYYGVGPGTDLPQTMMTPFLDSLIKLFQQGPGINGTGPDGGEFKVPGLIAAFLNDGQLNQLVSAAGVFDGDKVLTPESRVDDRLFNVARFSTMRGTVAFERLTCSPSAPLPEPPKCRHVRRTPLFPRATNGTTSYIRIKLNDAVYVVPLCQSGPGRSCPLEEYAKYVADKYASQGNFVEKCNVTMAGAPETVKGASFFTDLSSDFLQVVPPI